MEYKKSFHIAGLITKSIFGYLTDKEKKELSVWKNINSNNELFTSILSEDEFIKRQKKANKISVVNRTLSGLQDPAKSPS